MEPGKKALLGIGGLFFIIVILGAIGTLDTANREVQQSKPARAPVLAPQPQQPAPQQPAQAPMQAPAPQIPAPVIVPNPEAQDFRKLAVE